MTSGWSTDCFCIDAITGANPPPDFYLVPAPTQAKWDNEISTRVVATGRGKMRSTGRNRFGKTQVHPCNKSRKPIYPIGYFRSITMFLGRIKVSFDKSFLSIRFKLLSKRKRKNEIDFDVDLIMKQDIKI